ALAAVIPVTGWAAKRFGGRRLFLLSVVLFTLGSALCGLATSSTQLIAFRVLQGIGGGMIMPIGQMILVKKAGPANLARIMSAVGIPIVLAPVIGPTIGGLLLDDAGWRWIFYVNLPVGIAAVIAAARLLPRDRPENAGRLDATGLGLAAVGLVGITYGLAEIGLSSFGSAKVLVPLLAGLVLVAAFVLRALRIDRPLLDLRLYRHPAFSAASLTTFCLGAALFGGMILMPLYFQTIRHDDAIVTGLLLAPQGVGMAVAMWVAGRATERLGGGTTALLGGLISVVSTIPFVAIGGHTSYVLLSFAMVVRGFGIGMSTMPAMTAAYRVLQPSQINDATPQLSVLQRIGGSIGTAILTVVLQHQLNRAGPSLSAAAAGFGTTFWWVLGATAVATAPTLLLRQLERRTAPPISAPAVEPAEVLVEAG
ncbi:MAG: DHA2 family efflux MFS transporter permease subunit, partial [Acidimicrobiaceae bacterium]|nr:DHA2 family efflux MFS transporter permease subunit [Acidimicrobiaceae bacterium]